MRKVRIIMAGLLILCVLLIVSAMIMTQPYISKTPLPSPPQVSTAALKNHVLYLSQRMHPRHFGKKFHLEAVASYIFAAFSTTRATVADQWYTAEGVMYRNVIASYGPQEGPVLIVGAHYDSCPPDSAEEGDFSLGTPGADDNASGVAGLLELARLLQQYPPKIPVLLVAYCLEEPPFFQTKHMGSAVHARSLAREKKTARAAIVLESIGYFTDAPNSQNFPMPAMGFLYPDKGNFIGIVGRPQDMFLTRQIKTVMQNSISLPVYSVNAPSFIPGIDLSDHQSYWNENISAVMITDTAMYRNPTYHTAADTAEKLDFIRMAAVVQGVFAAIQSFE